MTHRAYLIRVHDTSSTNRLARTAKTFFTKVKKNTRRGRGSSFSFLNRGGFAQRGVVEGPVRVALLGAASIPSRPRRDSTPSKCCHARALRWTSSPEPFSASALASATLRAAAAARLLSRRHIAAYALANRNPIHACRHSACHATANAAHTKTMTNRFHSHDVFHESMCICLFKSTGTDQRSSECGSFETRTSRTPSLPR